MLKKLKERLVLIWNLARNDFANKYSANYLGVFWAFVQPIVTVAIYIFVFQMAFRVGNAQNGYPYAMWLVAGIVPWFFFGEGLLCASNAFPEYSYLVKKVVFNIDVLPLVKVISCWFVHLFFVMLGLLIFLLGGRAPDWRFLQIIYYMFCLVCLVTVLGYINASIVPFFKDFGQLVNVLLQIGMWLTPVMWSFDDMADKLGKWGIVFKLNPMFYIVQGYRDSFMRSGVFFWARPTTLYFWGFMLVFGLIARKMYQKMKPHFADVL